MARNTYDEPTAAAYKTTRELPLDGIAAWRDAVQRVLQPVPGMTIVDVGAGTGAFAAAFSEWFGVNVIAVEPSDAMREWIPRTATVQARAGDAAALPLPDDSADAAWVSNVLQHVPDLRAAAHEIRRVLRPGAPVLIRAGMSAASYDGIQLMRWFPETARTVDTFPSHDDVCAAFADAGFERVALATVRETKPGTLADFLAEVDTLRPADTPMRALSDEEFVRGKARLRRAVEAGSTEDRSSWLDFLVLR